MRFWMVLVAAAVPFAASAAGPPEPIDPGPVTAARIEITNQSSSVLTCRAVAARWFAFEFGDLPAGRSLVVDVSVGKANAAVMIVNGRGLPVPLETIYCGKRESLWATRSPLDISRVGAEALLRTVVRIVCRDDAAAVVCKLVP